MTEKSERIVLHQARRIQLTLGQTTKIGDVYEKKLASISLDIPDGQAPADALLEAEKEIRRYIASKPEASKPSAAAPVEAKKPPQASSSNPAVSKPCKFCGAPILFDKGERGQWLPFNLDGSPHRCNRS